MIEGENRFFRSIWRFNAMALAVALLAGLGLAAYGLLQIFSFELRDRETTNLVNLSEGAADNQKVREDLSLGYPYRVAGTEYARIPLLRAQSYTLGSVISKESNNNEANYLFQNVRDGKNRWLLPTNKQLFVSGKVLSVKALDGSSVDSALLYVVVARDSDGDKKLTGSDISALYGSAPDGSNYRLLIDDIEKISGMDQASDDLVLVIYQKKSKTILESFDVRTLAQVMKSELPTFQP
jgi:hypothetical protein